MNKNELLDTVIKNPLVISYHDRGFNRSKTPQNDNKFLSTGTIQLVLALEGDTVEQRSGSYAVIETVDPASNIALEEVAYWLADPFKNFYREKQVAIIKYIKQVMPEVLVYENLKSDLALGHVFVRGWKKNPEGALISQDFVVFSGSPESPLTHVNLAENYFAKPISL